MSKDADECKRSGLWQNMILGPIMQHCSTIHAVPQARLATRGHAHLLLVRQHSVDQLDLALDDRRQVHLKELQCTCTTSIFVRAHIICPPSCVNKNNCQTDNRTTTAQHPVCHVVESHCYDVSASTAHSQGAQKKQGNRLKLLSLASYCPAGPCEYFQLELANNGL